MSNVTTLSYNSSSTIVTKAEISWDKIVIAFVLFAITLVTIVGNVMVLIAVKMEKKLQTAFNYYIVNLAITDVAVAVMAMSFMATHTVLGYWPFGEVLCAIWIFFDYGMTFVSVFTLILISADRFWSVKWSVSYRQHHTKRKCVLSIICVWLFMLVLWVPPWILDRTRYSEPGICYWDPSLNKEFVFIVAVLGHHGPYCIMFFCYTHVFLFMRKRAKVSDFNQGNGQHARTATVTIENTETDANARASTSVQKPRILHVQSVRPYSPPPSAYKSTDFSHTHVTVSYIRAPETSTSFTDNLTAPSRQSRMIRERRIFVTLTYIIVGYAILWLPFHIVFDISIVYPTLVPEQVLNMAFWMAYFNSTINPVLYNFSSPEFRKAFVKILNRLQCK